MSTLKQDTVVETIKATPAVVGTIFGTLTLNEWVMVTTLIYIIIQAIVLVHKHYYFVKEKKDNVQTK